MRNLLRRLRNALRGPAPIGDAAWASVCRDLVMVSHLPPAERERLRGMTEAFLRSKDIRGAGGMEVDGAMRLLIAVQACVPVLNLGLDCYRDWVSVIVYPDEFVVPLDYMDEAGVVHEGADVLVGEAWEEGPVILSWRHAGGEGDAGEVENVVIHEFAHKLDARNGAVNGMPPLHPDMDRPAWTAALSAAFEDFRAREASGAELPFDAYAAEDPGEFFAVASEVFFMRPRALREVYPRVYGQFALFYRQDPASAGSPVS